MNAKISEIDLAAVSRSTRGVVESAHEFIAAFAQNPLGCYGSLTSKEGRAGVVSARDLLASNAEMMRTNAAKAQNMAGELLRGAAATEAAVTRADRELELTREDYEAKFGGAA